LQQMLRSLFVFGFIFLNATVLMGQSKTVIIAEESVIQAETARKERRSSEEHLVHGYRIFIGMSATRNEAIEIKTAADEQMEFKFPVQVVYDEPNFKVYIGNYTSTADLEGDFSEIRKFYPNAKKIRMPVKVKKP